MKKTLILMSLIGYSILVNAETINEFDITVEYEIKEQYLIANFIFDGFSDEYKIHIFMDNEVDSQDMYAMYGYVLIDYSNNNGFRENLYNMITNSIDSCCAAILYDLNNTTDKFVVSSNLRKKSNEIIILIKRLLIEALQTGKMNLTQS